MFNKPKPKSKPIIQNYIPIVLLFVLFVGFTACKDPTSSPQPEETYTVTFDTTGGTPVPEPLVVPAGSKIEAPEGVKKTNHSMGGWFREPEFMELWDFENDVVTCDITLYAQWGVIRNTGGGGGRGGSGGDVVIPGTSTFSQVIYQEVIDTLGIVSIVIDHAPSNTQGPKPENGDHYTIMLNGTTISDGTIQIVDNHVVFIPEGGFHDEHPFLGDFDTHNNVLSVDHIPTDNDPEHDISVPGAALIDNSGKIEGLDDDHVTYHHLTTAEHISLEGYINANLASHFNATPIDFDNQTTNSPITESWVVGYNEGYYGWEMDDMYKIHATSISSGSPLDDAISSPIQKGRAYYGQWKLGESEPKADLNVEIKEDQKTSLQFKGGGAPYKLDLNADYGHGFTVGYIEITASGSTNIVTLKVHLNDGYRLDGLDPVIVEWHSPNPGNLPNQLKTPVYPYFKIPNAETTVVYTGVPSNISFKGATFKVFSKDIAHVEHGYVPPATPGTGNLYFVSEEDHHGGGNTIIVAAPIGITVPSAIIAPYNLTVEEYGNARFTDYTGGAIDTSAIDTKGWIFVECTHGSSCPLCTEYYIGGTPVEVVPVDQIIEHYPGPAYYKIENDDPPPAGPTMFYDEHTHTYYMYPSDFDLIESEYMVLDDTGPHFIETSTIYSGKPLDKEYVHAKDLTTPKDLIVHAVHNDPLMVNGFQVGVVHVEYNRYEPNTSTNQVPYSVTITYDFDGDFLDILDNGHPGWSYTCSINSITVESNGIATYTPDTSAPYPVIPYFNASYRFMHTFKGAVPLPKLPLAPDGEKLKINAKIDTEFHP